MRGITGSIVQKSAARFYCTTPFWYAGTGKAGPCPIADASVCMVHAFETLPKAVSVTSWS